MVNAKAPHGPFLDTAPALRQFLDRVAATNQDRPLRIALDTEADSLHSYREKLCLIQFRCGDLDALIDPLAIKDLGEFMDFIQDQEVWFHGADYDLTLLNRACGRLPTRVYDTQIASRLLGTRRFGLAALLQEHYGFHLPKAGQKADWGRRPLTPEMIAYALDDVRYLLPLADKLLAGLREKGRLEWFEQSCAAQIKQVRERPVIRGYDDVEAEPWRVHGSGRYTPKALAYLRAIWQWRDREASRRDRPPFKVLSNEYLLSVAVAAAAQQPIKLPNSMRGEVLDSIKASLAEVDAIPHQDYPRQRRPGPRWRTDEGEAQAEALRQYRDEAAAALDLEASFVASRSLLDLAVYRPELRESIFLPWQLQALLPGLEATDADARSKELDLMG